MRIERFITSWDSPDNIVYPFRKIKKTRIKNYKIVIDNLPPLYDLINAGTFFKKSNSLLELE